MNNISPSSPSYHPVHQDKSKESRKRPRDPNIKVERRPSKRIKKAVKLDTLPFDMMEKICSYLTLPVWVRLGLVSRQLLSTVEWQGVWRTLNRESHLNLPEREPMTEFNKKVSTEDPSALRACSDLYIEGRVVDKDFHRALEFLQKIRANSQTKEEQANVDLEIALLTVRYSSDSDPYTSPLQNLQLIVNDEELSQEVRLKASFLMVRIYVYYSPSDPDDEIFDMVDDAYIYMTETADLEDSEQILEVDMLRVFLMLRDSSNANWEQELIFQLNEILKSENLSSRLKQEGNLCLAIQESKAADQSLTQEQVFALFKDVIAEDQCLPEIRMLAKFHAASVGMELKLSSKEFNELGTYLKEVSESSFIAHKIGLLAGFMYARMVVSNKINLRLAAEAHLKFKAFVEELNAPIELVMEAKFQMANLGFRYTIDGYSDYELYQHLVEVKDSVHLSVPYRWLARYFLVLMNIQGREGVLLHHEIVNELLALGNEPNLPDEFRQNVERQLQDFFAFPMDDDI